jgi:hypothetical protein
MQARKFFFYLGGLFCLVASYAASWQHRPVLTAFLLFMSFGQYRLARRAWQSLWGDLRIGH